jgi:CHAD domain-containing protein
MTRKNAAAKKQDSSAGATPIAAAAGGFNLALEECVRTGDVEAVHRVRTGSRRLQANLESAMRQNGRLEDTGKAWLRPLKQVRRAAGTVRDLDVHRKLLEHWVGKDSALSRSADKLDEWLKTERRHLAHRMVKQVKKRQQPIAEAQEAFLAAFTSSTRGRQHALPSAEFAALEDFMRAVDQMPVLHAENLHDFRKATKKARYVAESGASADNNIAKALKRVQDSIGEWHDWLCLHEEAKVALGEGDAELLIFLEQEVEKHFALAMKTTQTIRARLTGEWMAMKPRKRTSRSEKGHVLETSPAMA